MEGNTDFDYTTISLFGLGKLGLCLAALYAKAGKKVIGVDIQQRVVDSVNVGIAPLVEPGLDALIGEVGGKNLVATTDATKAFSESMVSIVLTATPSLADGSFSNEQILNVLKTLAKAFRTHNKAYHLFVISSTVMPGSLKGQCIPLIEQESKRSFKKDFDVCYLPDFVALGNVLHDFTHPDLVVIGESSKKAGDIVARIHKGICANNPPFHRMSLASAEIAKVSLNAYITMKISFANVIGNICEKVEDTDPDAITKALGCDKRISPYYFKAGLAFGGTCFPRDTWAFTALLRSLGYTTSLMDACNAINHYQDTLLFTKTMALVRAQGLDRVSVLGLAFKAHSPVIEASPSITLIRALQAEGIQVCVYDALAMDATRAVFADSIWYAESVQSCLDASKLALLMLPQQTLIAEINEATVQKNTTILDPWRVLDRKKPRKFVTISH